MVTAGGLNFVTRQPDQAPVVAPQHHGVPDVRYSGAGGNYNTNRISANAGMPPTPVMNYHPSHGPDPDKPYKKSQRPGRIAFSTLLMSLFIAIWIATPIAILFVYMYYWHSTTRKGMTLETGADPTNLLGILSITTKGTEQGTVIIMALMATSAATKWWRASQDNHQNERPTGVQLSLMMDVLNSANIYAAVDGLGFLWGRKKAERHYRTGKKNDPKHDRKRVYMPSYMRNSILLLVWLLTLHISMSGLDWGLHFSTQPAMVIESSFMSVNRSGLWHDLNLNISSVVPRTSSVKNLSLPLSRTFNNSRCDYYREQNSNSVAAEMQLIGESCALVNPSTDGEGAYVATPAALRVLSNVSADVGVAWANDGTAIAVPARQVNISYTARAVAAKTQCISVTNRCVNCLYVDNPGAYFCQSKPASGISVLNFSCDNLNLPVDTQGNYPMGIINPSTNGVMYDGASASSLQFTGAQSNPFRFAFVASSLAYINVGNWTIRGFTEDTGFITWGTQGLNVVDCDVTLLDTVYSFVPPNNYTVISSTNLPLNQTRYVSYGGMNGTGFTSDAITSHIQGAGVVNGTMSFADAAALQISKQFIAWSSILLQPDDDISLEGFTVNGAKISVGLLGAYLALAFLYLCTTLCVGISSFFAAWRGNITQSVVQARLLKPYAVVADAYGRKTRSAKNSLTRSGFRTFAPQRDADRLDLIEAIDEHEAANGRKLWRISVARKGASVPDEHDEKDDDSSDE